jgi:hypothetical protein
VHILPALAVCSRPNPRKSASNARDLIVAFDDACARQGALRRGAMYEDAVEHCSPNEVRKHPGRSCEAERSFLVCHQARRAGPAISPRGAGRPVLLLPEGATRKLSSAFDHTLVAWDHSRPAARAVADALPMLRAANSERRRRYPRRFLPVRGRSRRPGHTAAKSPAPSS